MSVKSASNSETHGSTYVSAWNAVMSAAAIHRKTSMRPSIFTVQSILSSVPSNPAKHGFGAMWIDPLLEK
jgi:hypothetical protein